MALGNGIRKTLDRVFAPDPVGLPNYELHGIPGNVQRMLDDAAASAGKKIWRGMVQAAASGFGKGVILAALLVIGFSSLGVGFAALAEEAAFMGGFWDGAVAGLGSLFYGAGPLILGVGGLLGMAMDIRQHQSKISAEVAKAEAAAFEAIRLQKQTERGMSAEASLPEVNFAAREAAKRATLQPQMIGK